jgi:plasmid stabilization system protein ParE
LFVRRAAKADVAHAFTWHEERRTGLGHEFADEVAATYAAIEEQPLRFPVVLDDIRMAVMHRFPYLVYFVVLPRGLSVIAVLHGHRDPQVWQRRR